MLRHDISYRKYNQNLSKNYTRGKSNRNDNAIKINLKYLIAAGLLIAAIVLINLKPDNRSMKTAKNSSKGKVLPAADKAKPINLVLPQIEKKLSIIIPQKNSDLKDPYIPAKNVFLYDADNAYPLFAKNAENRVPIASTTKIMTAIIALENYKLDQIVIVTQKAANIGGSIMKLHTDEKITVENLLYGLMLSSGNDAAYALANLDKESKDGNTEPFVKKMNEKAKLLGLENTNYKCPAGLDDTAYSTAHDMAIIMAYAIKNPVFKQIINSPTKTVNSVDNYYVHNLLNTNRLIIPTESLYLPYSIGGKTGNTDLAGHCLISAAQKDGRTLISVVLNTASPAKPESARLNNLLITWGYNSYTWPTK